jgi:hypothetical protein
VKSPNSVVVQSESVLKGNAFTACGKTLVRVVMGLCPVKDHRGTMLEQEQEGRAASQAVEKHLFPLVPGGAAVLLVE